MIEVRNLTRKFKTGTSELIAVNDLSFKISKSEFIAVTGKSGSGKSTLLYQLGLLDRPSAGEVLINGDLVTKLNSQQRTNFRLRKMGYVFQDYALIPSLTAQENVLIPLLMRGESESSAKEKAALALEKVGLKEKLTNLPNQLSGGQQQRVSIARAIAHSPEILFADEPTANLDSESSQKVLNYFLELNRSGQTIIMVTHETEYAALTHRIIELSDGKIIKDTLLKISKN